MIIQYIIFYNIYQHLYFTRSNYLSEEFATVIQRSSLIYLHLRGKDFVHGVMPVVDPVRAADMSAAQPSESPPDCGSERAGKLTRTESVKT